MDADSWEVGLLHDGPATMAGWTCGIWFRAQAALSANTWINSQAQLFSPFSGKARKERALVEEEGIVLSGLSITR